MNKGKMSLFVTRSMLMLSFLALFACSQGGGDGEPKSDDDGTVTGEIVKDDTESDGGDTTEPTENTEPTVFKLSVSQPPVGTITSTDGLIDCGTTCDHEYDSEEVVTLNASVEEGYQFLSWLGDCSGIEPTCEVTVKGSKQVAAQISANDIAGIGSQSVVRAGLTIGINYSGSTNQYDYAGIFEVDASNKESIERVRLPDDYGSTLIRVPTIPGTYQLRMYNDRNETIVIGHDLEVLPYEASFSLQTQPLHPMDRIEVNYSGSTNGYDYIATYAQDADNAHYSTLARLTENNGVVTLKMPPNEGNYEIRMINDAFEVISSDTVEVDLSYSSSVSAQTIASTNETINVNFSGSTQNYDYIAVYPQNVSNSKYLDLVRLNGLTSGMVTLSAPEKTGIYTIKMVNESLVTMSEHRYLSVLDENNVAVFAAPDLAAPSSSVTLAYSGTDGSETIGIFKQGATNDSPLASVNVIGNLGNTSITAPSNPGYYEVRLLDQKLVTLAQFHYLKVVDASELLVELPQTVSAGETLPALFSGSSDDYDYLVIYPINDLTKSVRTVRVAPENGMLDVRMPTVAGEYIIKLLNSKGEVLKEGNTFTVEPYKATLEVKVKEVNPKDDVVVEYSGSTDDYDYIGFFEPGSDNKHYSSQKRLLLEEGSVTLSAPATEGDFEIRMFNDSLETIVVGPTLKVFYGDRFVGGPQFSLPGESVDIAFNGSTQDDDFVALYEQETANSDYEVRQTLKSATDGVVEFSVPNITGLFSLRMVNGSLQTIIEGEPIAVLDPAKTEVFVAHEVTHLGDTISIAYSSPTVLEHATVGIYEQGAHSNAPLFEQVVTDFPVGLIKTGVPNHSGIYEIRLVNTDDAVLASAAYLYVLDSSVLELFIPNQVRAGEVVRLAFSGSDDEYDYGASYEAGQENNNQHDGLERLIENEGTVSFRVPTVPGNYNLRMIDSDNQTKVNGNEFVVLPYSATASFPSVAKPTEVIEVHYSGSTYQYDYIGVYVPGADNNKSSKLSRLKDGEGVVSLTMPDTVGSYEVRMINDKYETIAELGTIEVSYDHTVAVSAQSIATPGEEITVSFEGSTGDYDYIALCAQESDNNHAISLIRLNHVSEGNVQLTMPIETGIYDIRMVNQGMVTMSNNITVSVLDSTKTEIFIAPEVVIPGQTFTMGYSGSFAGSNKACVLDQWTGEELNCISLDGELDNTTLEAPMSGGIYDVEMRNASDQTLAASNLLYVIDASETVVYGPDSVVAGDTVRFIYAGSTDTYDRIAFIPQGESVADTLSGRLLQTSGAIDVRVPTIEGNYRLVMVNSNREVIVDSGLIVIEPYDGEIGKE